MKRFKPITQPTIIDFCQNYTKENNGNYIEVNLDESSQSTQAQSHRSFHKVDSDAQTQQSPKNNNDSVIMITSPLYQETITSPPHQEHAEQYSDLDDLFESNADALRSNFELDDNDHFCSGLEDLLEIENPEPAIEIPSITQRLKRNRSSQGMATSSPRVISLGPCKDESNLVSSTKEFDFFESNIEDLKGSGNELNDYNFSENDQESERIIVMPKIQSDFKKPKQPLFTKRSYEDIIKGLDSAIESTPIPKVTRPSKSPKIDETIAISPEPKIKSTRPVNRGNTN